MSRRGISTKGFLNKRRKISHKLTTTFNKMETKKPITMIRDASPGLIGCLIHNMPIARRKQTLQMKAARMSILNKAIVQKSKFLHKIALFCLNYQFHLYELFLS